MGGYLLCGGDLFNRYNVSISTVRNIINLLNGLENKPMYMVLGNHDIYGHNPDVVARTMAGILEVTGLVDLLHRERSVVLSPDENVSVRLTGVPYHVDMDNDPSIYYVPPFSLPTHKKLYSIHLVHGYLVHRDWPKHCRYTLVKDVSTEADIVLTGHEHYGYGIVRQGKTTYCNPGALGRVQASIGEVSRKPAVAVIDLANKVSVRLIPLKTALPGEEVLDRSRIEQELERESRSVEFQKSLKTEIIAPNLSNILEEVGRIKNVDIVVKEEAKKRISAAQERLHCEEALSW